MVRGAYNNTMITQYKILGQMPVVAGISNRAYYKFEFLSLFLDSFVIIGNQICGICYGKQLVIKLEIIKQTHIHTHIHTYTHTRDLP